MKIYGWNENALQQSCVTLCGIFITNVCDIFRKKGITMISIKAIIITTITINFIVNSTKFGSKTKLNQNLEQTKLSS